MWERKGWDGMGEVRRERKEECGEACEPLRSQDWVICAVKNDTGGGGGDQASLLFMTPSKENVAPENAKWLMRGRAANSSEVPQESSGMETICPEKGRDCKRQDDKLQEKGTGMEKSDGKC